MFNMKNSKESVKSRGVLLFAFNTDRTDYVEIARRATRLIQHTLELPVTLITDNPIADTVFDQVIYIDNTLKNYKLGEAGGWRNGDRYQAYNLSPYDETLLIDSDYLQLDRNLLKLFDQLVDYRIMTHNDKPAGSWRLTMGMFGLPYQWATTVLFKKTAKSKMLFDLVGRIQRNYYYYIKLYHIRDGNFRNDYAFTIANNILNGYDLEMTQGVPWSMLTFADVTTSIKINGNLLTVREREKAYAIPRQNIHVMDKGYLLSDDFKEFVDAVCAD
jgi:hypothetical protein